MLTLLPNTTSFGNEVGLYGVADRNEVSRGMFERMLLVPLCPKLFQSKRPKEQRNGYQDYRRAFLLHLPTSVVFLGGYYNGLTAF